MADYIPVSAMGGPEIRWLHICRKKWSRSFVGNNVTRSVTDQSAVAPSKIRANRLGYVSLMLPNLGFSSLWDLTPRICKQLGPEVDIPYPLARLARGMVRPHLIAVVRPTEGKMHTGGSRGHLK